MSCATLTNTDYIQAFAYASSRALKDACTDPSVINKFCGPGNNCLTWKDDNNMRLWRDTCIISKQKDGTKKECTQDLDCDSTKSESCINGCDPDDKNKKFCGFTTSTAPAGHCHITTREACLKNSDIPYNQNDCSSNGNSMGTCSPKTDPNTKPYLEWRPDTNKCVLGNWIKKMWAEQSEIRPGQGGRHDPPFFYDDTNGQVHITKNYCTSYGTDYGSGICNSDADCVGQDGKTNLGSCTRSPECPLIGGDCTHICNKTECSTDINCKVGDKCIDGHCIGEYSNCLTSTGQEVGEMLVGKTIFRDFKDGRICEKYEPEKIKQPQQPEKNEKIKQTEKYIQNLFKSFNNIPEVVSKLGDSSLMSQKKLVGKDFGGPGIHLYAIVWSEEANILPLCDSGFDADEVSKVYKNFVIIKNGKKYIKISRKDIKNNNNIKRLYISLNSGKWLFSNILNNALNKNGFTK